MSEVVTFGSISIPVYVFVVFGACFAISAIMGIVSHSKKKRLLETHSEDARIVGKGVTFQSIDGNPVQKFHQGQHVGIVASPGTHTLIVIGSSTSYHGITGKHSTTTQTRPTPISITVNSKTTYDLSFDPDAGFSFEVSKKSI